MKKTIRHMFQDFTLILAGVTLSTTVFCTVFYQNFQFGVDLMWQMVALAFFTSLPHFVFVSKKELSKKQLLIRQLVHVCLVLSILIFFAYYWGWLQPGSLIQPIVFIMMVAFVYAIVTYFAYQRDKKVARQLNERLQKYKQRNTD